MGTAIAAGLSRAGADSILIARGRRLEELRGGAIPVLAASELAGAIDLAICCTKTLDLQQALEDISGCLNTGSAILTLQNGVEAHQVAAARFPEMTVLAGRLHGFFELDDGAVRHVGVEPSILMGRTNGDKRSEQAVQEAFSGSGFAIQLSPDIEPALWEKFMLAAGLGGVGLALAIPAGQVASHERGSKLLRQAMAEIAALASHCGIALKRDIVAATLAFAKTFPANATTSLQRDVEAGLPSEYDAIVGAIRRIATQKARAAPVFERLEQLIAERLGWRNSQRG